MKNMKKRAESEKQRYGEYYNLDPNDKKIYDLVIDTTRISADKVVEKITEFLKKKKFL
jgi:cytidylate kinase